MSDEIKWSQDMMLEVSLKEPDDFLKVRETLTRVGVASRKERKLYQSCHILHKRGKYYIVHFKELFALDGKPTNITSNDVQRRNRITKLLSDWGLVEISGEDTGDLAPLNQIKVLSFKEHDIGGLDVKRILPNPEKRMVGPFIFLDHMGPTVFKAGQGINVRPHPHIGLSTLTYLFE